MVNGQKIRHMKGDCANVKDHALYLMLEDEFSTTEAKFLFDFRKYSGDNLSKKGIKRFNCVKLKLEYYYEVDRIMTTVKKMGNPKFIHGIEKFLFEFNSLHKENIEFHGGLLCCLLHKYVKN